MNTPPPHPGFNFRKILLAIWADQASNTLCRTRVRRALSGRTFQAKARWRSGRTATTERCGSQSCSSARGAGDRLAHDGGVVDGGSDGGEVRQWRIKLDLVATEAQEGRWLHTAAWGRGARSGGRRDGGRRGIWQRGGSAVAESGRIRWRRWHRKESDCGWAARGMFRTHVNVVLILR